MPKENKLLEGWRDKNQYAIPVLIGASQASLMRDYKLEMTPTHFLLDTEGQVIFTRSGYEKGDEVELEQVI